MLDGMDVRMFGGIRYTVLMIIIMMTMMMRAVVAVKAVVGTRQRLG